ncbi:hypothetical protein [Paucihalobacter sp.]|uniref:hypothetical protein n=1 Tax=Paucihalobacter sp. TaxID=2850405 RepID=UPI002FE2578E
MQYFKAFFDFYLNASFHVALVALSFLFITAFEYDLDLTLEFQGFVFFATIVAYNFVKYYGVSKNHFKKFTNKILLIRMIMLLSFLGIIYTSFFLSLNTILHTGFLALITLFYATPFVPKKWHLLSVSNLRNVAGIKVYIIALVWAGVSVVLPLIENDIELDSQTILTTLQRFILVIVLMLPFEIRDLQFDDLRLETIPQKIGIKTTKVFGFTLIGIIALLEYLKGNPPNIYMISLLLTLCFTAFFLRFMNISRSWYYTAFWVESVPIVWMLLLLLL